MRDLERIARSVGDDRQADYCAVHQTLRASHRLTPQTALVCLTAALVAILSVVLVEMACR